MGGREGYLVGDGAVEAVSVCCHFLYLEPEGGEDRGELGHFDGAWGDDVLLSFLDLRLAFCFPFWVGGWVGGWERRRWVGGWVGGWEGRRWVGRTFAL